MMGQGESPEQRVGCPASGPRCDPLLPHFLSLPTCKGAGLRQGSPKFPSKFPWRG